jgi:hypothetical protein
MQWSQQATIKDIPGNTNRDSSIAAIRHKAVLMIVNSSWFSTVEVPPLQPLQQHLRKVPTKIATILTSKQFLLPLKRGSQ